MPAASFKELGLYIREVADLIGLRDWTFDITREPANKEDAYAQIRPTPGRKHARIWVCHDWIEHPPEKRREFVVHELVHCHFDPAAEIVRRTATQLGTLAYEPVWEAFNLEVETGVDGIADNIAQFFPPYPTPKTRRGPRKATPPPRKRRAKR